MKMHTTVSVLPGEREARRSANLCCGVRHGLQVCAGCQCQCCNKLHLSRHGPGLARSTPCGFPGSLGVHI